MPDTCTSDEALAALTYLRNAWGGFTIPEPEERAHMRVFRTCMKAELVRAIDELVLTSPRRPSPSDVAQRVRMVRRANAGAPKPQAELPPAPASERDRWLTECRRTLAAAGAHYPRKGAK